MLADGQTALSWSGDKSLRVWNLATGDEQKVLTGHTDVGGAERRC